MVYENLRAPEATRHQLEAVVRLLRDVLGTRLIGVYLHGSLAMGSFQPERSDLDVIAVCDGDVSDDAKTALARGLLRLSGAPHPVELHVCAFEALHPWRHPCPFAFHYSEGWRGRYEAALAGGDAEVVGAVRDGGFAEDEGAVRDGGFAEVVGAARDGVSAEDVGAARPEALARLAALPAFAGAADPDLAAHVRVVRDRGVALRGRPIEETFPAVPNADYRAAIVADVDVPFRDVSKQPVYYVLNWLRVLRFAADGAVLSKEEAGVWGMTAMPLHIEVVADALKLYRRPEPRESLHFDVEPLQAFVRACSARLG